MLREIVLDTETTGVDYLKGDRIIEIGCVELINHIPSGRHFHCYINPQYPVSAGAFNVHGLSDAFLAEKADFSAISDDFESFIAGDRLVIHNASFDVGFLNMELAKVGKPALAAARVLDTLSMARRKHPGASNSLDALCKRYGIDNSRRTKHGALMDAEILAEVYIELIGGRQTALGLIIENGGSQGSVKQPRARLRRGSPLPQRLSQEEAAEHEKFVSQMTRASIWAGYE